MVLSILVLTIIIVALTCHLFSVKKQIQAITKQMKELSCGATEKNLDISLIDNDLDLLAAEINKSLKRQKQLRIDTRKSENRLKDSIANISHDLRTPLTSLTGYLQLMQKGDLSSVQQEQMGIALRKARQLQELIVSFYELTIFDSDDRKPKFMKINYTNLLMDTITDSAPIFEKCSIYPEISLPEESVFVLADEEMLRRILQNLLSNMAQYAKRDIKIILLSNDKTELTFTNVISKSQVINPVQLFDRFYTSDVSRSNGSTGLGLAIVKILVEKMGGSVCADLKDKRLQIKIII